MTTLFRDNHKSGDGIIAAVEVTCCLSVWQRDEMMITLLNIHLQPAGGLSQRAHVPCRRAGSWFCWGCWRRIQKQGRAQNTGSCDPPSLYTKVQLMALQLLVTQRWFSSERERVGSVFRVKWSVRLWAVLVIRAMSPKAELLILPAGRCSSFILSSVRLLVWSAGQI